jgi:prepilin-type N-terminal cleavage/methylation domain-containing protein
VKAVLRAEHGFTLVEVVVAIMVLSLVTVAVVQIYNSNLFGIILSGNRTEAIYDVQQKLEKEIARALEVDPADDDWEYKPLEIHFEGKSITIPGWIVEKDSTEVGPRHIKVSGTVFIPDPKNEDE